MKIFIEYCLSAFFAFFSTLALGQEFLRSSPLMENNNSWGLSLLTGSIKSNWSEYLDISDRQITELGYLPSYEIELFKETSTNIYKVYLLEYSGVRSYDGWSSSGKKVFSISDVRVQNIFLTNVWKFNSSINLGLRLEINKLRRNINGTSVAQGYLERYSDTLISAGIQRNFSFGGNQSILMSLWLGTSIDGKMTLYLAPYDASPSKLGRTLKGEASLSWIIPIEKNIFKNTSLITQLIYQTTDTNKGSSAPIVSNGSTIGSFIQPHTVQSGWQTMIGVEYLW